MKRNKPTLTLALLALFCISLVLFATFGTKTIQPIHETIITDADRPINVGCDSIEVPWLYINGTTLRELANTTYKNRPLYFSSRIVGCGVQSAGWFMKKGGSANGSTDQENKRGFDPGPQVKAYPVAANCGSSFALPESVYISDFTMDKKLLESIIKAESPWIILEPILVAQNGEIFIKWKVYDTLEDPTKDCGAAAQQPPGRRGSGPNHAPYVKAGGAAPIGTRNTFDFANPVPPYPAEID